MSKSNDAENNTLMPMHPQHTQFLMSALNAAVNMRGTQAQVEHGRMKLRALEAELMHREETLAMQLSHERQIFSMKADLMRDLVKALIEQRVDAVRQGFVETLATYAEQCRHYMAQQERYADAEIKATEPLERANLRTRLSEIDLQLSAIRSDAAALYREMTKVILLIGGNMPGMSTQDQRALTLTKGN
jgi:hypothetical protein